ncbi:lipoyl(octanoyl) transferase [Strigomonas culicis]|uniref:lipoyl(octanoyl) transferase n=1 Tax=Strigomonas culicis TaxID=28005 RepID=S9VM11_9TRYP|nr:lipoyl(octanoyl) transferase [Strigomonas culicis]EPY28146.1 lipoyl(octanoyl) transferase [Strigomonas culicis]|eukprot:EPY22329.1 lipoyl(octanoyl) transferase [Strigomonas culicis]
MYLNSVLSMGISSLFSGLLCACVRVLREGNSFFFLGLHAFIICAFLLIAKLASLFFKKKKKRHCSFVLYSYPVLTMKCFYVGKRTYQSVLAVQERLFNSKIERQISIQRKETTLPLLPDVAILVEHANSVYTLGRRDTSAGLPQDGAVEVVRTKRGGGITYLGPGQVTMYPIANIQRLWKGCASPQKVRSPIEWFSAVLEQSMMQVAAAHQIPTHPYKTGVWADTYKGTNARKLGSIGLQLGSWVSMHGAALNVTTDLSYFDRIVMCELPGKSATSLSQEIRLRQLAVEVPSVAAVAQLLYANFTENLHQAPDRYTCHPVLDVSTRDDWDTFLLESAGCEPLDRK